MPELLSNGQMFTSLLSPFPAHLLAHTNEVNDSRPKDSGYNKNHRKPASKGNSKGHSALESDQQPLNNLESTGFVHFILFSELQGGLPWWSKGEEFTRQSRGFDPRSGKIPHATEQLSPFATTTEPELRSERNHCHCSEKPMPRD